MSGITAWHKRRLLVPRWHKFNSRNAIVTLGSMPRKDGITVNQIANGDELGNKISAWQNQPNLVNASELLDSALVFGDNKLAKRVAGFVLRPNVFPRAALRLKAAQLVDGNNDGPAATVRGPEYFRALGRLNPADAISWTELAYHQTINGHLKSATKSVLVSISLAPNNRHVLRAANRFFLHIGDVDRAHKILTKSDATKHDPWLMAAEIASAEIAGKSPATYRSALQLLASHNHAPFQISELASSLATLEMNARRKQAKRFFDQSLENPSGNALAQAAWAQPIFGQELLPENFAFPQEHEGLAHVLYSRGLFESAFNAGLRWIEDEPYANRPFEFASATAGIAELYDSSISLADKGLKFSLKKGKLLATKSFALARQGKFESAISTLALIDENEETDLPFFILANYGLIALRQGRFDDGDQLYRKAIEGFKRNDNTYGQLSAYAHYAYEAIKSGHPTQDKIFREAEAAISKNTKAITAKYVLESARQLTSKRLVVEGSNKA
jgi:tetratricopeptide (TPR) repeat protein